MCLAIWKPKGKTIEENALCNAFRENSDGAGLAFIDNGKLAIDKGFFNFASFLAAYRAVEKLPCLIHFRWSTCAKVNKDNCHPFAIGEEFAVIHNGILPTDGTPDKSDTAVFVDSILSPLVADYGARIFRDKRMRKVLEGYIGKHNKVCVLSREGKVCILNKDLGHWKDGVWFSNHSYTKEEDSWRARMGFGDWDTDGMGHWSKTYTNASGKKTEFSFPESESDNRELEAQAESEFLDTDVKAAEELKALAMDDPVLAMEILKEVQEWERKGYDREEALRMVVG